MTPVRVNYREILRYLGYRGKEADERTLSLIKSCLYELEGVSRPKNVSARYGVTVTPEDVCFAGLCIRSKKLAQHLRGCEQAIVFAATLGPQADRLMARYERVDMSRAVVMKASAAALVEAYCDECCAGFAKEERERGLYLRPRFSPGYSDFSILHQRDILRLLDAPKKIGLSMTESCMLVPVKSVTAIIGLTGEPTLCAQHKCADCSKTDCPFREEYQ